MARKTITILTDDLTDETLPDGTRPVTFTYEGTGYEIFLSDKNRSQFENAIAPYLEKATVTSRTRTRSKVQPSGIRAWAVEKGLVEPGGRGRLAKDIIDAYNKEHGIPA